MKVVLLKEVPKLGRKGDVKDVPVGYARNFLIPHGLADMLNKHTLNMLNAQKNKRERIVKQVKQDKSKLAKKIDRKTFTVSVKTDEKGTIYAGLGKKEIAEELKKQGFSVEQNEIATKNKLKKIGTHKIDLNINNEKVKIKLEILSENYGSK